MTAPALALIACWKQSAAAEGLAFASQICTLIPAAPSDWVSASPIALKIGTAY